MDLRLIATKNTDGNLIDIMTNKVIEDEAAGELVLNNITENDKLSISMYIDANKELETHRQHSQFNEMGFITSDAKFVSILRNGVVDTKHLNILLKYDKDIKVAKCAVELLSKTFKSNLSLDFKKKTITMILLVLLNGNLSLIEIK